MVSGVEVDSVEVSVLFSVVVSVADSVVGSVEVFADSAGVAGTLVAGAGVASVVAGAGEAFGLSPSTS